MRVEHGLAGVKRARIVKDTLRNTKASPTSSNRLFGQRLVVQPRPWLSCR